MSGDHSLRGNVDAEAAAAAMVHVTDNASRAQTEAVLALAYEQRTIALIEAAKVFYEQGHSDAARPLLDEATSRMGK